MPIVGGLSRRALRLVPDVPVTIRVGGVGPLRIRLRSHRGIWIKGLSYLVGTNDASTGILGHLIRPGDVVYDVGANIGLYARVMVHWFGARQVIAFEPMHANFELLSSNVALGGDGERIRTFEVALGDAEGEEQLQIDDMLSGTAVLDRVSGGRPSAGRQTAGLPPRTESVRVVPLDSLVEREKLPGPDVMKIDTEGAAALVLKGGLRTIERYGPRLVVSRHNLEEAEATVRLLSPLRYACFGPVLDDGREVYRRLEPGDEPNMPVKCDILCSRDPAEVERRIAPLERIPDRGQRGAG